MPKHNFGIIFPKMAVLVIAFVLVLSSNVYMVSVSAYVNGDGSTMYQVVYAEFTRLKDTDQSPGFFRWRDATLDKPVAVYDLDGDSLSYSFINIVNYGDMVVTSS